MAGAKEEEEEEKIKNKKQRFDEPHGSLENLPFDSVIEMEILPRLPLKSILRLELASKPLSPLISDHLRRHYRLLNAASGLFFTWPMFENHSKKFYHTINNSKFVDDTLTAFPRIDEIIDCCNGLLLCHCFTTAVSFVCNPLTGQWASIPNSIFISHDAVLAFYPRISGHYNILRFRSRKVHVFSSETGSWVEKKQWASHSPLVEDSYPLFFNGKVYFPTVKSPLVKIFDRQGSKLVGIINLPHPQIGVGRRLLGHSGGRLHFAVKVHGEMLVWVLDDCNKWILKHRVSLLSIFGVGSCTWDFCFVYPRVFHPDMDVVFMQVKNKIVSYNMDNGDLAEVCNHDGGRYSIFVYSPCYSKDFNL